MNRYRSRAFLHSGEAATILFFFALAGCGGGGSDTPSPTEPPKVQAVASLAFVAPPGRVEGQVAFTPALEVEARDASGKRVTSWNGSVTLALKSNPGQATLGGTLTRPATNGVARFDDLTIELPGTGYTLRATAEQFEVVSTPFEVGLTMARVSAGLDFTCGLTKAGKGYCWGKNSNGELGTGSQVTSSTTPVPIAGGLTFATLDAGYSHTCAVTTDRKAYCWGAGKDGQLGSGATSQSYVPMAVAGSLAFETVSGGTAHSCGVTTAGKAYCWGAGGEGRLGNGTTAQSYIPVAVSGNLTYKAVSAGLGFSCGMTVTGASYCWGAGWLGQVGNGSSAMQNLVPVATGGNLVLSSLTTGYAHACGVTTSGSAYCWGYATPGTLGTGDGGPAGTATYGVLSPKAVAGVLYLMQVSGSDRHTCAVSTTNKVYCWGDGESGRLGHGTTKQSLVPAAVWGDLDYVSVSAGATHSCAVTLSGEAHCWGSGAAGALGNGSTTGSVVPVVVSGTKH